MGYAQALLARDVYDEKKELEAQARKKDLWSGLGRTIGTLTALGITGGMAAPWVTGAWAGGLTAALGAAGSFAAGDIEKGDFFKGERKELRHRLDPWGEENIVGGISAAVTAGLGQKLKMAEEIAEAKRLLPDDATADMLKAAEDEVRKRWEGKGLDFAGSTLGKTKAGQFLLGAKEFGLKDTLARHGMRGGKEYAERVTKEGLTGNVPGILQEYEFGGGEVPAGEVIKAPLRGDESRYALPSSISQITQQAPRGRRDWTFSPSRGLFDWLQSKGFYKPDLEAHEKLLPSDERFV